MLIVLYGINRIRDKRLVHVPYRVRINTVQTNLTRDYSVIFIREVLVHGGINGTHYHSFIFVNYSFYILPSEYQCGGPSQLWRNSRPAKQKCFTCRPYKDK
jgi:hypothetical protein